MNIYLVVEGRVGEKLVYGFWVPLVNSALKVINKIDEVTENCLYIISGKGYPSYFDVISDGIEDVVSGGLFNRLVIAIDSENMSYEDKRIEIQNFVESHKTKIDYRIIVQHFCLETWALGNRIIITRYPKSSRIRDYRKYFDVLFNDPELLPNYPKEDLTRSQFAEKYLRSILNEKYKNLSYSKRNPQALLNIKYFERVRNRYFDTRHISSFEDFLDAFI
jgi:hypothetical protein